MDAFAFIVQDDNLPFAVALAVMAMVGIVSAVGLELDADGAEGVDIPVLNWVNPGHMPMLASLTVLLCIYSLLGLAGQQAMMSLVGHTADALPAGLGAIIPAGLIARPVNRRLARILPKDETSAITIDQLVGRRGRIEIGTARSGFAARARFVDGHGQMHMLMVEPSEPDATLSQDEEILLVSMEDGVGRAIAVEPSPFLRT